MNKVLKTIFIFLLNKKYIGGRHTQEERLIKSKIKWLERTESSEFKKEYKKAINEKLLLRTKKRTGKGSDWHISLNPRRLKEVYELIE